MFVIVPSVDRGPFERDQFVLHELHLGQRKEKRQASQHGDDQVARLRRRMGGRAGRPRGQRNQLHGRPRHVEQLEDAGLVPLHARAPFHRGRCPAARADHPMGKDRFAPGGNGE